MNSKLPPKTIAVAAVIICTVFFLAFNNSFLSNAETVSQNIKISGKTYQSDDDLIIRESQDGQSFVKFQNGRVLKTNELAEVMTAQGIDFTQAQAVSVATDDFNADGYPDLVVGCAAPVGGFLLVYFGDEQAFAPSDQNVIRGIAERLDFPVPFKTTTLIKLPDAPDFLFAGDFDRDGKRDILTATRGGQFLNLTANEGGSFAQIQQIAVGGFISTVAAGRKNLTDDFADVFVGTSDGRILIYEDKENISAQTPFMQNLDVAAEQIALGNLDEDGAADLAIVANKQLFISHGDDALLRKDVGYLDSRAGRIEAVNLPFAVSNLTLGEFVWDRDSRTEIAATGTDGAIRVLTRGQLDTRPFTEAEITAGRLRAAQSGTTRTPMNQALQRQIPKQETWEIGETFDGDAAAFLTTARSSAQRTDDLLLNGAAGNRIRVLSKNDAAQTSSVELVAESDPVAVLPMRLNVMQPPGLVILRKGQIEPTLVMLAPQVTFNVTTTSDISDPTPDGTNNSGSLREAIQEANGNGTGADMITFTSGINPTLTISSAGAAENAAATGDLDINGSVTIMGNSPTTISTTYNSTCGDCKLFGVNQVGNFPSLAVGFTGVTIQNGFNNGAGFAGSFFETGGGIDFFITGAGTAYSITNSTVTNNTATGSNISNGGGVNVDGCSTPACPAGTPADPNNGTVTFTSSSITNNTAQRRGGGINLQSDKHDVTMTSPVVTGNTAQQLDGGGIRISHSFGGTITISGAGSSVSNNSAVSGGGIDVVGNQVSNISNALVNNNTSTGTGGSSFGGGIVVSGLGALNVAGGTTLTSLTITNNHADNGPDASGGGVVFGGNYGFSMSGSTITGNTSKIGAGVLNQGSGETPAQVLTLTNCTIRGNTATGDGISTGFGGGFAARGTGVPSSSQTTLTNVTIGGAGAGEGNSAVSGGAIANMNTSATTVSGTSTIFGNTATTLGGGIFSGVIAPNPSTGNTVTINNNVPIGGLLAGQGNSAPNGGGVALNVGTFNYTATSGNNIAGNSSTTTGGGLFNNGGTANLTGVTFSGNTVPANAAEVRLTGGTTNFSGTITIPGELSIAGGTLAAGSSTVNLSEDFNFSSGTFTAGTSTFSFNGTAGAVQIYGGAVPTFFNLTNTNTTGALVVNNNANANGNLTVNANAFLTPAATSVIGGTGTLTGNGVVQVTRTAATADFSSQYTITNKTLTNLLVDYVGTAPQIISAITYGGLRLNNANGATLASGTTTVGGTLTLQNGTLAVSTNTLVLNSTVTQVSGTFSSASTGTVNYNQSSNGQSVLAGNYGNLTFSNFNKILPAATIGIAGTFTPGSAVGHTVTGSNINFNGTLAQTVPVFPYEGLTLANAAGANLGGNVTVNGTLGLASGTLAVGTNTLTLNSTVTATSGLLSSSATGTVNYNQGSNGQNVLSANYGNLTFSNFNKTLPNGSVGIAGTFTPGSATGHTITGNTINFNGSTAQTIPVFSYNNLSTNVGGTKTLAGNTTALGTVTIGAGSTLSLSGFTLNVGGGFTNNGTFNGSFAEAQNSPLVGGNVVLNGTATQIVGGTTPTTFNDLTVNNAAGITVNQNITVNGILTLTSGTVSIGTNTLTINSTIIQTGGSLSSAATGTVNYNQSSNGQSVLAGNYGNLTFSNFNKVLPAATIGIAGTFTPGSAVGHTVTGNNINFNGTLAQTVPVFPYEGLTLANAAGASLGGNVTVNGALGLAGGILAVGTNTLTLNGAVAATGGSLSSAVTGTVNYNQGTNGQSVLAANYGNLTFSNFNKTLPTATVAIAGTFTPGNATGHTITGNTINFNGSTAQTIPAFQYNNLTSSSTGGRTLANTGTIGVAAVFTPGTNAYTVTGSTMSFNGAGAQTIPAFTYGSLQTATGGVKTTSGAVNAASATVGTGTTLVVALGSTLTVTGTLTNNGTIQGLGTIANNFSNGGTLAPGLSPGILNITGTFTNTASVDIEIGGTGGAGVNPNGHDQILITGAATLGGTLNVTLTNGFTPAIGNSFLILDAASSTGTFTTTNLPNIAPNVWSVVYNNAAGTVTLNVMAPNAATVSVAGRVLSANGRGISRARVTITNSRGETRTVLSGTFGSYRLENVIAGESYVINVNAKRYRFAPRVVEVLDEISDLDFTAEPSP